MDQRINIERYKMVYSKYTPLFKEVTTPVADYPSFEAKNCRVVCDPVEKETSLCMIKITAASAIETNPASALERVMEEQLIKCVSNLTIKLTEKPRDNDILMGYTSSNNSILIKIDTIERVPNSQNGYDLIIDVSDESKYTKVYAPGITPGTSCSTMSAVEAIYSSNFYISAIQINGVMTKWLEEDKVAPLLKWRERLINEWDEFFKANTTEEDQYGQWITKETSPNYIFAEVLPVAQTLAVTPMPIWTDFNVGIQMGFPIPQKKLLSGDPTLDIVELKDIYTSQDTVPQGQDTEITISFAPSESSNPPSYSSEFNWNLIDDLKNNRKALIRVTEVYHENYKELGLETARFYIFTFCNIQILNGTIPFTIYKNGSTDEFGIFSKKRVYYKITDSKVRHYNEVNVIKRIEGVLNTKEFIYKIYVGDSSTMTTETIVTKEEIVVNNTCGCK